MKKVLVNTRHELTEYQNKQLSHVFPSNEFEIVISSCGYNEIMDSGNISVATLPLSDMFRLLSNLRVIYYWTPLNRIRGEMAPEFQLTRAELNVDQINVFDLRREAEGFVWLSQQLVGLTPIQVQYVKEVFYPDNPENSGFVETQEFLKAYQILTESHQLTKIPERRKHNV